MVNKKYTVKRENKKGHYYLVLRDDKGKQITKKPWSSDPVKRHNAKNKLETRHIKKYWETHATKTTKDTIAYQQLLNSTQRIQSLPNTKKISEQINKKGSKNFTVNITDGQHIDNSKLFNAYRKILGDKTPKENIAKAIKTRSKTIKPRLTMTITLYMKNEKRAEITVGGILLEQQKDALNYWNGLYIDSNTFEGHSNRFKELLHNPTGYIAYQYTNKAGTINKTNVNWTFA
jgi:hypothetical protein